MIIYIYSVSFFLNPIQKQYVLLDVKKDEFLDVLLHAQLGRESGRKNGRENGREIRSETKFRPKKIFPWKWNYTFFDIPNPDRFVRNGRLSYQIQGLI